MKIVRKIGGFPSVLLLSDALHDRIDDDPIMPLGKVVFWRSPEWFGYWKITDQQPCPLHPGKGCVEWTLTRGPWLQFRTWLKMMK